MAAASARGRGGGGGRSTGWYASASGAVAATVAAAARRAGGDDDEDEDEDGYDDEDEDEDDEYDDDEYDELDAAQREARNTPLPGVLLEAQDQLYALYGNEGVTEQVEAVLLAGSHPHFAGTILTVIAFLKAHFKVVNDVSLIFPELDLEFRQDSVHTRANTMEQLLELHEALQKSKGVAADKAVPLRVRFVVYPTNFYARWNHLESLRHKGAAPNDPIVLDSDSDSDADDLDDINDEASTAPGSIPHALADVADGAGASANDGDAGGDGVDENPRKRQHVEVDIDREE